MGLPEAEVMESRERVRAALQNAQFDFRKITVNLAPADLPKESGRFDLPIALGVLAATEQLPTAPLARHEFADDLALTGALRSIRGALPMALCASRDGHAFVLPEASAAEAALARTAVIYPASCLRDVCAHIAGQDTTHEAPVSGGDELQLFVVPRRRSLTFPLDRTARSPTSSRSES